MPHVPLVDITVRFVTRWLAMATVRRAAVVVDVGVLRYNCWKNSFVDVTGREIGLPEVASLIRIVEVEVERLGKRII